MRAFRANSFRADRANAAAGSAKSSSDLTDEQKKAMRAEFDRRILTFQEKWRLCPGRRCRRRRQCLGPPFACLRQSWMRPYTNKEYRRLRLDLFRSPPRIRGV